jgi:phosphatidylglycerophosphate synthase
VQASARAAVAVARPPWIDRARLRRIRNVQSAEFYSRLVMRPLAILIMLVVADWKWLTPNRVTAAASLAKVAGAALIAIDHHEHALLGAALLQLGLVFDHLDGTLARYRGCGSTLGSFYDKVSDAITWLFITGALGFAAYRDTGNVWLPIAALTSAYALLVRGYMKWLLAAERGRVEPHTAAPSVHEPPTRTAREWAVWLASSLSRALWFDELDLFLWVGIGVVIGRLDLVIWLLVATQLPGALVMIARRAREARAIDLARTGSAT